MFRSFHPIFCAVLAVILVGPAIAQTGTDCPGTESWVSLGTGLGGKALASAEMNGNLYVLHEIPSIQPDEHGAYQISMWNGSVWSSVTSFQLTPQNMSVSYGSRIAILEAYKGSLYMAGIFDAIDGNTALGGIARWDGSAWRSLSGPLALNLSQITALGVHGGNLLVAATVPGDDFFKHKIMQWNGTAWSYFGDEESQQENLSPVQSIVSWKGSLYICGNALRLGSISLGMILRWDGNDWESLVEGDRVSTVAKLFIHNDQLYANGNWASSDGTTRRPLARWDGIDWLTDIPWSRHEEMTIPHIVSHAGQIYMVSPKDSNDLWGPAVLDRFDGTAWRPVSDFDNDVTLLASHNGNLFAGGNFTASCDAPVANFAVLHSSSSSVTDPAAAIAPALAIYPNPTHGTLSLHGELRDGAVVKLRNLLGEEVARYPHDGSDRMTIDASALPAGTYLLEAETTGGITVERIAVVR